jgi:hypothetical protein
MKAVYMAKVFNRITVATPTGLTPTLAAGGSLTPGVTYYYRIIGINNVNIGQGGIYRLPSISLPSEEVSATPDAGNRTINLTWDALLPDDGFQGYIIQRTLISGSYPVDGANTFNIGSTADLSLTTLTGLQDNGTIRFNGLNYDYNKILPVIECYGTAGDVITLSDLYEASVSGGWGDVDIIAPAGFKALPSTSITWRDQCPYAVYGNLWFHDCTLQHRGALFIYGTIVTDATVNLQIGHLTSRYNPSLSYAPGTSINRTDNNASTIWTFYWILRLSGTVGSLVKGLTDKPIINAGNVGLSSPTMFHIGYSANVTLIDTISKNPQLETQLVTDCIFEGLAPQVPMINSLVRYSTDGLNLRASNNLKYTDITVKDSSYDQYIGYGYRGNALIDCLWKAKGQTDNKPYYSLWGNVSPHYSQTHFNTMVLRVTDPDGNPVVGATVNLFDVLGNPAFFVDSGATFSTTLNDTDNTSLLTVSNGALFTAGDIIRLETYAEYYQVQSINGDILTITRGYGGTAKRITVVANAVRVFKAASLVTGADGRLSDLQPIVQKEIEMNGEWTGGYEDDLVTSGNLIRNYRTPHTLTITKDDYQRYQDVITVDRKMDLEVALGPLPPPVHVNVPSGEVAITLSAPESLEVSLEAGQISLKLSESQ